jgi:hypothetical protein
MSGLLKFFSTPCLIKDSILMVAVVFPYLCLQRKSFYLSNTDWCLDGIATSSGWMHLNPGFVWNSEECSGMLPWRSNGCNLELFKASRHWLESRKYCLIVWTDVVDWWVSRHYTGPSERKLGIQLLWLGILHGIFFELLETHFWNSLLEACDTTTCHNKVISISEK